MDALRRIQVGALTASFPAVQLPDELAKRFLNGQPLALGKEDVAVPAEESRVRVYSGDKLLRTAILGNMRSSRRGG